MKDHPLTSTATLSFYIPRNCCAGLLHSSLGAATFGRLEAWVQEQLAMDANKWGGVCMGKRPAESKRPCVIYGGRTGEQVDDRLSQQGAIKVIS